MCKERNAKFFVPEKEFLMDNGVNIAWLGILQKGSATKQYDGLDIKPYERTDDVRVSWKQRINKNMTTKKYI